MRFPIFALSFVDAFVFLDVFDAAFLPDDTIEDCDATEAVNADVVDVVVEEGWTVTITSVMLVVAISAGGGIVTNEHLVRARLSTGGIALAAAFVFLGLRLAFFACTFVDAFLFLGALGLVFLADDTVKVANVDGSGDVEGGDRVNDAPVVLAGLPTGGVALGIMIVFWQFSY